MKIMKIIKVESSSAALQQVQKKLIGKVIQIPDVFARQNVITDGSRVSASFNPKCSACMEEYNFLQGIDGNWYHPNAEMGSIQIFNLRECRQKLKEPSRIVIETDTASFSFAFLEGCFAVADDTTPGLRIPSIHTPQPNPSDNHVPIPISMHVVDPYTFTYWSGSSLERYWKVTDIGPLLLAEIRMRKSGNNIQRQYSRLELSFKIPEEITRSEKRNLGIQTHEITGYFPLGRYNEKIQPILWIDEIPKNSNDAPVRYLVQTLDMKPLLIGQNY